MIRRGRIRLDSKTQAIDHPFRIELPILYPSIQRIAQNIVHSVGIELAADDIGQKMMLAGLQD